ncbi:MAG: hypothetical protein V1865_01445 [bacterium]
MTSIAIHKERIQEHLQEIKDALTIGLEKRPATLGLHISACSLSLLELYLHVLGKISVGTVIKHDWFKRPKPGQKIAPLAERKLGVEFPLKGEIFSLLYSIEEERNKLIYGRSSLITLEIVLKSFQQLHQIIKEKLEEKEIEIE